MTKLTTQPNPSNDFMRAATMMPSAFTDIPKIASSGSEASAPSGLKRAPTSGDSAA